jgi:citrate lyase alpha subunit
VLFLSNLLLVEFLDLLLVLEIAVAGVVIVVTFPISQTQPTELICAHSTSHVIASSVLFDEGFAFGTVLSVGGDPVLSLRFVLDLFLPQTNLFARSGEVGFLLAFEAK